MKNNGSFWSKVSRFVAGNGFYLVVLVCVAAIGVSGYYLVRGVMGGSEPVSAVEEPEQDEERAPVVVETYPVIRPSDREVSAPAELTEPEETEVPAAEVAEMAEPVEAEPQEDDPEPSADPEPQVNGKPIPPVFTRPVNGAVIATFSVETLLYDETMLDWRVHEGVDLAAEVGTRVLSAAAGKVTEVYEDELMGVTVVIDHGEGLVSVYSNLLPELCVEVGERVYTGDVLGAVGDTAAAESGRAPHLHFALYRDGVAVDPEEYLPQ